MPAGANHHDNGDSVGFFAIIVSIVRLKQGYTPARFYILSWSTLFLAAF